MAEFLTRTGISGELEKIIKGSQGGRLLLISPYLSLSRSIRELLEEQARRKTSIYIVYGKKELRAEVTEWLDNKPVFTVFRDNLHAKCYMNGTHALVTSMNLYQYSQENNDEMGILVSAEEDSELYNSIRDEADRILRLGLAARNTGMAGALGKRGHLGPERRPLKLPLESACAVLLQFPSIRVALLRFALSKLGQIQERRIQREILSRLRKRARHE